MRKAFSVQLQCPGSQKISAALDESKGKNSFLSLQHSAKLPFRTWHQNFFFRSWHCYLFGYYCNFFRAILILVFGEHWTWNVNRIFTVLGFAPRVKKRPPLFYVKNAPHSKGRREGAKKRNSIDHWPLHLKKSLIWWCQSVGSLSKRLWNKSTKKSPPPWDHFLFHSL